MKLEVRIPGLVFAMVLCLFAEWQTSAQTASTTQSGNTVSGTPAQAASVSSSTSTAPTAALPSTSSTAATTAAVSESSGSADQAGSSGVIGSSGMDTTKLNFQADLFTGRFTYSIPIKVSPARQGVQPSLNLGYSSSGGNGWCGMGWTLDTAYIQRDVRKGVPIKPAVGYTNPPTQYDDTKGFDANFGGSSSFLVLTSPTNQNPLIYRQQVDTAFLTYKYFNNNHWEVTDKNGSTFYFGEGLTNQMENTKTNWPQGVGSSTYRWALDRVIDANGNATYLNYTTDGGILYLTNIAYNANVNSPVLSATHQVNFVLTNRPDTNITFISGFRMTQKLLLAEIDVQAGGANVRKYVLNYITSSSTLRSLLASVTEYGADYATPLPAVTFNYSKDSFTFGPDTSWSTLYSQGDKTYTWNDVRGSAAVDNSTMVDYRLQDIDGDGLPDRVMSKYSLPFTNYFAVQRNTGGGFTPANTNYIWGGLQSEGLTAPEWNAVSSEDSTYSATFVDFVDINGDGYPDRVMRGAASPFTNFVVQLNSGISGATNSFGPDILWTGVTNSQGVNAPWDCVRYFGSVDGVTAFNQVDFIDMNGDGLPDRVSSFVENPPFNHFEVQLNNGTNGFAAPVPWYTLDSQGQGNYYWNSLSANLIGDEFYVVMIDINGDGLPDRVMRTANAPYNTFFVQFNNGAGFEPAESFGSLNSLGGYTANTWNSPIGTDGSTEWTTLQDINGDGLPDRIVRSPTAPYTNWYVQLNTGSGFGPPITIGPLHSEGQTTYDWNSITAQSGGLCYVDFVDVNGDGLPDRVMKNLFANPITNLIVELNQGPFPDLLNVVSNGIGGSVQVSYVASTSLDNRNTNWVSDPWSEGTKSLLPYNVWVVSQVIASDGMGTSSTNSYAFKGGYYNAPSREFRGFSQCTVTDPLGAKTVTYFHQSGGRDNSALGEFADQGSVSKKGMPFRSESWGTNGLLYQVVLNKVQEYVLNPAGWYFPCVTQKVVMNYEGLNSYRAAAIQYAYDTNTENLIEEADFGEVTNIVANGQTFSDVGNDSIFKWMSFTNIASTSIYRPYDTKVTSDGVGANRLQERQSSFDGRGNLLSSQAWLNTAGGFIMWVSNNYDQYGNLTQTTDAAGITTTINYDSTYEQFPISQTTGTFTSSAIFDIRSGATVNSTDIKGLVTSNSYDVFYRPVADYISTNSYGPPVLWQSRTYYSLGGIQSGVSYNFVHNQVNDAVDTVNGFETYAYLDGLGRTVETRSESETGQFRVANVTYNLRGNIIFATLPYFNSGTNYTPLNGTYLGSLTGYDSLGRANVSTPAVNGTFASSLLTGTTVTGGDVGSPVGSSTTTFVDASNPWATVVTDSMGKTKKAYRDAYGRTVTITDVTTNGNNNTTYAYDVLGNLTNITDSANNQINMGYDSLGRKTSMIDPDMGTWSYVFDNAGRLKQQTDAKTNTIQFNYNDQLGRLTSKQIYNSGNSLVGTITYAYDFSTDPNYTVYPGQLYKVTDLQGYERSSYDVRGRVIKNARYLNVNSIEYVTQTTYDDADRVQQLTYPFNAAIIKYTYDTAGHVSQVKSLAGTGTQEVFYTLQSYNALNQLAGYICGNGVTTSYTYYANSKQLKNIMTATSAANIQNLSYTYDKVSDVTSVADSVYSGSASASIGNIAYDDLYRVTSVASVARGTNSYSYNSIGNLIVNQDLCSGGYTYGSQPHAVANVNGVNYYYDPCGNMTKRGNQSLIYDSQNQLVQVSTTNDTVIFGYDNSGERLYRAGTNGYTVWIGGIYEVNSGKVLCHVFAGGKMIASFEPLCGGPWSSIFGEKNCYVASTAIESALIWPFQKGRGSWTMMCLGWTGIMAFYWFCGRKMTLKKSELRKALRPVSMFRQVVTLFLISAILSSGIGNAEAATFSPVFYYYHSDHLGSSNVLTDRSGNVVQHYEYTTFGKTSYQNNSSAFAISNRYTGQIADDETGLLYYGGRYYDPQLGRFIQPDPTIPDANDSQSLNRYSYCRNNPCNETDPTGFDDDGGNWGAIGDVVGGAAGGLVGDLVDFGQSVSDTTSFTSSGYNVSFGSFNWSANFSGGTDSFGNNSFVTSFSGSAAGNFTFQRTIEGSQTAPQSSDGVISNPGAYNIKTFTVINFSQATAAPTVNAPSTGSGGWVAGITNVAGLLSMIPGPVGTIAGLVNAAGEGLQGNWGAAAIGVGGALLATVGLGFIGKIGREAAEGGTKLLPQFTGSTIDDVVASAARARSSQITEGARAIAKKLGHAESGGYTSAFQGVAPTSANAESLIRNIMSNPSRTFYGNKVVDIYNAAGQGVRIEAGSGGFKGFLEGALSTQ